MNKKVIMQTFCSIKYWFFLFQEHFPVSFIVHYKN